MKFNSIEENIESSILTLIMLPLTAFMSVSAISIIVVNIQIKLLLIGVIVVLSLVCYYRTICIIFDTVEAVLNKPDVRTILNTPSEILKPTVTAKKEGFE